MDDLEPVESVLTYHTPGYHLNLRQHLLRKAPTRSDVQFLILPSFEPETLASVYEVDGAFEAQVVRPEKQIWSNEGEVEEIDYKVVKKKLPVSVATRLKTLWESMLMRTR